MKHIFALLSTATFLIAVSCVPNMKATKDFYSKPSPWPYTRGSVESRGVWLDSTNFDGQLTEVWQTTLSHKPAAPLTIYHNSLIVPTTGKRIRFYDSDAGTFLGQVKLDASSQTAAVLQDSFVMVGLAPSRNQLQAIRIGKKKASWRTSVKDASSTPIIVNDRLVISSGDGNIVAINPATGHRLWRFTGEGKFIAPASYGDGRIFQPSDKGILFAVSETDGKELYRVKLDGPLVSAAVVTDMVYVATTKGNLYALRPEDGSILWQAKLAGPVWGSPAVTDDAVIVGHSAGEVVAFGRHDGSPIWKFAAIEVIKASPLVVGQYVVVGSMGGKLWVLNRGDGQSVVQKDVIGAIAYPPVTDGARVFVATQSGRIYCYGEPHEQLVPASQ